MSTAAVPGPPSGRPGPGTSVLVSLDGSLLAERALPVAHWAAVPLGGPVALLAVAVDDEEATTLSAYLGEVAAREGLPEGAAQVLIDPDAAETIRRTAVAGEPMLVCLASHGLGRAGGPFGSVATVVTAGLGRPVLVVGPEATPGPAGAPVFACVDGSPACEVVLGPAAAWAGALGVPLHVVTVYEPVPEAGHDGRYRRRHGPDSDADRYVDDLAERALALGRDQGSSPPTTAVGVAIADPVSPTDGLMAHLRAQPAQLVVVATHARTGLRRFVLGSEAARIVGRSPRPVLTVPLHPA